MDLRLLIDAHPPRGNASGCLRVQLRSLTDASQNPALPGGSAGRPHTRVEARASAEHRGGRGHMLENVSSCRRRTHIHPRSPPADCSLKSAPLPALTGINPDLSPAAILTPVLFTTVRFPMISRRRKLSRPERQQQNKMAP